MLKINGRAWDVVLVTPRDKNLINDDGIYTFGMTDNILSSIFISNALYGEMLYKVLCHEIAHAYSFSYNIKMDREEEERLAQFVSEYGRSIVSDTDKIVRHILNSNIAL